MLTEKLICLLIGFMCFGLSLSTLHVQRRPKHDRAMLLKCADCPNSPFDLPTGAKAQWANFS